MNHREMKVNRVATLLGAVFLMLGFRTGPSGQRIEIPDAVYYNGKVITVDASNSIKEAFAVKRDKFLAVGTSRAMRALAGPQTQLVDLRGRAVMPGLMDNHNHAYHAALASRGLDLREVTSLAGLLERVRQAAEDRFRLGDQARRFRQRLVLVETEPQAHVQLLLDHLAQICLLHGRYATPAP